MNPPSKFCGKCGISLEPGARFCGECGASLNETGASGRFSGSKKRPQAENPVDSNWSKRSLRWLLWFFLAAGCLVAAWVVIFYLVEEVAPSFVNVLAWSPDEKQLISAGPDGSVQLWDAETGDTIARADLGAIRSVNSAAWSQDGKLIAIADDKQINLYQLPGLHFLVSIPTGSDHPIALCFDPNGSDLYTMSGDFSFSVWDYQQQQRRGGLPGLEERLIDAANFSGDCRRLVTLETMQGDQDLTVYQRINMESLMTQTFTGYSEQVDAAGLNATGNRVVAVSSGTLKAWAVDSGKLYSSKKLDSFYVTSMAVGSRNTRLALGGSKGRIRIYGKQGTLLQQLQHGSALGLTVVSLAELF